MRVEPRAPRGDVARERVARHTVRERAPFFLRPLGAPLGGALLVGALAGACGGHEGALAPPPSPSHAAATASARAPEPLASATSVANAQASAPATAPPSPFFVVNELKVPTRLLRASGKLFVEGYPVLAPIERGAVVRDDRYRNGIGSTFGLVVDLAGSFPDDAFMAFTTGNGRVGWGELYKWKGGAWVQQGARLADGNLFVGIAETKTGLLALSAKFMPFGGGPPFKLHALSGAAPSPLPQLTPSEVCGLRVVPQSFRGWKRTGHLFVLGDDCERSTATIEWFGPGEAKGHLEALGVTEGHAWAGAPDLVEASTGELYVAGTAVHFRRGPEPVLARFDGKAFHRVTHPFRGAIQSMAATPDGALWVVAAEVDDPARNTLARAKLWRGVPPGAWAEVSLPESLGKSASVKSLAVDGAGELWATTEGALLRTRERPAKVEVLEWEPGKQLVGASFSLPKAATPSCESNFALFYAFTKVTPDDYDFPETRKALKGQRALAGAKLVVVSDGGRKYFGAIMPDFTSGRAIVERVKSEVKGSSPQLLCARPQVVRELTIDLATGAVKKAVTPVTPASPAKQPPPDPPKDPPRASQGEPRKEK